MSAAVTCIAGRSAWYGLVMPRRNGAARACRDGQPPSRLRTLVDGERMRADGLAKELAASRELAAVVEPLRTTVQTLQSALDAEKQRLAEIRQERDRLY